MMQEKRKKERQEFEIYLYNVFVARIKAYSHRQAMAWFLINKEGDVSHLGLYERTGLIQAINNTNQVEVAKCCPNCFCNDLGGFSCCPKCDEPLDENL